ncbi:MAG TPA: hypothetical protein PKL13_04910 [bacterium]|nr:hypothetical protein [bacterium]
MENNYLNNNQQQDIDLSNVLDSAIEQKQQMMYQNSVMSQSKSKKKKKTYLFIIIISWIVIFGIVFATLTRNAKIKEQREKIQEEMRLKIQKRNVIQNQNE